MDISEESRSSAVEQTLRHHGAGSLEDDEAGCNWDVEALQFVVDSFLHLFLEEKSNCQRQQRRVRKESRGTKTSLCFALR